MLVRGQNRNTRSSYNFQQWINSREISEGKREILQGVQGYLNAPSIGRNPQRRFLCEEIFRFSNLPDLYFFKFVKNELLAITERNSSLRDMVLPLVTNKFYKEITPYVGQTEKAAMGIIFLVVSLQMSVSSYIPAGPLIFLCYITLMCGVEVTEMRVGAALKNILYKEKTLGILDENLEDSLQDLVGLFMEFAQLLGNKVIAYARQTSGSSVPVVDSLAGGAPRARVAKFGLSTATNMQMLVGEFNLWQGSQAFSQLKREVLQNIIRNIGDNQASLTMCKNIFAAAHLPEIIFVNAAMDQLEPALTEKKVMDLFVAYPKLKNQLMSYLRKTADLLMTPHNSEVRQAGLGLAGLTFILRMAGLTNGTTFMLSVIAAMHIIFPHFTTEVRVKRATQDRLYAESHNQQPAAVQLGDGLDDSVTMLIRYSKMAQTKMLGFLRQANAQLGQSNAPAMIRGPRS